MTALHGISWRYDRHEIIADGIVNGVGVVAALIAVTVINIWSGYPFFMISLLAGLQGIPSDLYEAARVDGAGPLRQFVSVTLPGLKPILYSMALLDLVQAGDDALLERACPFLDRFALLSQLQQVLAARAQFARADRLDQEIDDACFQRGTAHRLVAHHADQDDRDVATRQRAPEPACELEAVHVGHAVVEQHEIGDVFLRPAQRLDRILEIGGPHARAYRLDHMP